MRRTEQMYACEDHYHQGVGQNHHPPKSLPAPSSPSLGPGNHCSTPQPLCLAFSRIISYKWKHSLCLEGLASLTEHNAFHIRCPVAGSLAACSFLLLSRTLSYEYAPRCSAPFICDSLSPIAAVFLQGAHAVGRGAWDDGVCAAEALNLRAFGEGIPRVPQIP